ncbi:MAG: hypothetical protein RLZZ15_2081 [Verrucomicrobiota bacterium]
MSFETGTATAPEQHRLRTLRSYAILDTPPEDRFSELAEQAARVCQVPASAITLVDEQRCWLKARVGLDVTEAPRNQTFCDCAFASSSLFVVPDAAADPRFRGLPLVTKAGFRFYAAAPLIVADGTSLGTLCVLDVVPRELTRQQLDELLELSFRVTDLLESRRRNLPPPAGVVRPKRTVLVVDDEIFIRQMVAVVLERSGVTAIEAADGAEGLELFRARRDEIGLVLTDVQMPVMDGYALVRELQADAQPPLIAAMSGRLDETMRARLTALGVSRILAKPFGIDAVQGLVALLPPAP